MNYLAPCLRRVTTYVVLVAAFSISTSSRVAAQDLPQLSTELKSVIENDGLDAGKKFFADVVPAKINKYTVSHQAFGQLASDYMQAGNMEAGLAVSEMFIALMQATKEDMFPPEVGQLLQEMEKKDEEEKAERKAEATRAEAERKADYEERMGPTRDDLDRFTGLYGDPSNEDTNRTLWISKTCEGRLAMGASWGDAVPWYLISKGDSRFSDDDTRISFENDGSGQAITLIHNLSFIASELARVGDLPSDWKECITTGR